MYTLGIDMGTTFTAAATWRDGHAEIVPLGSRGAAIPSVVLLREDETFLTGEAANRRGLTEPHRVAREFKRRLGDTTPILLGGVPQSAEALASRLLRAVADQVIDREGGPPSATFVCHPANWGPYKIDLMRQAVRMADLEGPVSYTTEPEAAAVSYAQQQRIEPGGIVAVYDLGGGTFDAAVLRKTGGGFDILGRPEGIERLGGIDFDAAVFHHVRTALGGKLEELDEDDPAAIAAVARLRDECVAAKEALSSDTDTTIPVLLPNVVTDVRLTRSELEAMVRPALYGSVEALKRAVRSAGCEPDELHSVLLVGGSSRMPVVAQMVTSEFGRPVSVDAHPKHAVALGAAWLASGAAAPPAPGSMGAPGTPGTPASSGASGAARAAGVAGVVGAAGAAGVASVSGGTGAAGAAGTASPSNGTVSGRAAAPPPSPGRLAPPSAIKPGVASVPNSSPPPGRPVSPAAAHPVSPSPVRPVSPSAVRPVSPSPGRSVPSPRAGSASSSRAGSASPSRAGSASPSGKGSASRAGSASSSRAGSASPSLAGSASSPPRRPGSAGSTSGGRHRKRRLLVAAGLAFATLLAVGGVAYAYARDEGKKNLPAAAIQPSVAPTTAASTAPPADELCTNDIKNNRRWVCLTSAVVEDGKLTIKYDADFADSKPNINSGYHLHIYGGDGKQPPDHLMGSHAPKSQQGEWYVEDRRPSVLSVDDDRYIRAIGDAPKVCARIAVAGHGLVPDKNDTYKTGNCVPITRK